MDSERKQEAVRGLDHWFMLAEKEHNVTAKLVVEVNYDILRK